MHQNRFPITESGENCVLLTHTHGTQARNSTGVQVRYPQAIYAFGFEGIDHWTVESFSVGGIEIGGIVQQ